MIVKFIQIVEKGTSRQEEEIASFDMQNIPRISESVYLRSKGKQFKVLGVMYDIEDNSVFVYIKS